MSFFEKKREVGFGSFSEEEYVSTIVVTKLGEETISLLNSYLNINVSTEVEDLLQRIINEEVTSQRARDSIASIRDKLQAKISLLQAVYAILPKENWQQSSFSYLSRKEKIKLDQT